MKRRTRALVLCFVLGLAPISALPVPPLETPLFEQIQDINPCTGQLITLTFIGVAVVHEVGDKLHLRAFGEVITSDGYVGRFNRTFFFKGDQVETLRFHDMEVNSATGQRVIFNALVHVTTVGGQIRASVEHVPGARCVGRGAP